MIKVIVRDLFHKASHGIWVIKDDEVTGKSYIAGPVPLIFTEVGEGSRLPEPTFELNNFMHRELLDGLAKGLAEAGYEVKNDRVHGERDAMAKHLGDLQKYMDILIGSKHG